MTIRFYGGALDKLAAREVGVIAATRQLGRDGHILEPAGVDLSKFRLNPICLWQHDPMAPVGTATAIGVRDGNLAARIEFAPEGASELADQICSLVKAGVVRGVSVGFNPLESEPLDRNRPRAGQLIIRAELMELSFVSVPADTGAGVVARSAGMVSFRALPAIPSPHVRRAAARVSRGARPPVVSPTMHVWLLVEQRRLDREVTFGFAARQTELRRLSPRYS